MDWTVVVIDESNVGLVIPEESIERVRQQLVQDGFDCQTVNEPATTGNVEGNYVVVVRLLVRGNKNMVANSVKKIPP